METPVKKKSSGSTTPVAVAKTPDTVAKTPDAPIKLKLPMLDSTPDAVVEAHQSSPEIVPKHIDFDREETRGKHCGVFVDRLSKFYIDAVILIEIYEDLLIDTDYKLSNMTETKFICTIMKHIRDNNKTRDYSAVLTKYGNINLIVDRAITLCHDNDEIKNKSEKIKKYLPVITKLVKFCEFELKGIPSCLKTGREMYEEYGFYDISDDEFKHKYLKYKKKYLELKKSLTKK